MEMPAAGLHGVLHEVFIRRSQDSLFKKPSSHVQEQVNQRLFPGNRNDTKLQGASRQKKKQAVEGCKTLAPILVEKNSRDEGELVNYYLTRRILHRFLRDGDIEAHIATMVEGIRRLGATIENLF